MSASQTRSSQDVHWLGRDKEKEAEGRVVGLMHYVREGEKEESMLCSQGDLIVQIFGIISK